MRALAGLLVLLSASVSAQTAASDVRVDLVLRGVPASEALAAFADAAGLNVAYSTALVGSRRVWCGGAGWAADRLLRCITDAAGLDYVQRSSGTYVVVERIVEPIRPGVVAGLVVDAETGEGLPFASVRVAGAPAITDASGRFAVAALTPGAVVLAASYVGYDAAEARITVSPGTVSPATVRLRPVVQPVGAVVVDGLEHRLVSESLGADVAHGTLVLDARPSRETDAAPRLAETAPALTSGVEGTRMRTLIGVSERTFRDGLSLQGGEAGEHVVQIDGATVYEPLAIGPVLGAMSPLAVGRVTVRKAGFGARHGSHLAGVVQAEHSVERPANGALRLATEVDIAAASARLQHAARLGTWRGETVEATSLVAARRGLWDVRAPGALSAAVREWNRVDPLLAAAFGQQMIRPGYDTHRHGSDVTFSDLHAATRVRIGPLRSVRASAYHGAAGIGTELVAQGVPHAGERDTEALLIARDGTHWTNTAASVRAEALLSARWRAGLGARLSRHTLDQRYDAATGLDAGLVGGESVADAEARLGAALDARDRPDNGNDITEVGVGGDATVALGRAQELTVGTDVAVVPSRFHLLADGFGLASFRDLDAQHTQVRASAFADGSHRIGTRWTLEPGLRITALAASGDVVAEPRIALRFDGAHGVSARVAAGVYRQFASRVELATLGPSALVPAVAVWLPVDRSVAPPSALHLAAEALWQPSAAWSFRAEGYAKSLPHAYALDYTALIAGGEALQNQSDFLRHETGRALGIGTRAERQAVRWAASASLALAMTERRSPGRFDGRWTQAAWAEPVRATLGLDVLALGRRDGLNLLVRVRGLGVWGRAWAFRRAYYDILPAVGTEAPAGFALGRPDADRLPPRIAVDAGLAATLPLRDGRRVEFAADIANVLNRRDVLDWSLAPDAGGALAPITRTLPGIQPSLRVRVSM